LQQIYSIEKELQSLLELLELSVDEEEIYQESLADLKKLHELAQKLEIECLFQDEFDQNDCFLEIHAGAGGTESNDWAEMLLRMYTRWLEKRQFEYNVVESVMGEEAGVKSVILKVKGSKAFGWLKTEKGVHRLVRISPFNSAGKRHTSFANVWIYPKVDDEINIQINDSDLRIDTYRSSGAGGQHVNTTDSAVRITHLPTKIVVQCQNNRSQHRNKEECMSILKARLLEYEKRNSAEQKLEQGGSRSLVSWGSQIRSYVLHPYKMVKDLRTNVQTSDTNAVLDGGIDLFLQAALQQETTGKGIENA
jgi:peptide chain release factor 2